MEQDFCPCKRTNCPRHGDCAACREHHRRKHNSLTYCEKLERKVRRTVERKARKSSLKITSPGCAIWKIISGCTKEGCGPLFLLGKSLHFTGLGGQQPIGFAVLGIVVEERNQVIPHLEDALSGLSQHQIAALGRG